MSIVSHWILPLARISLKLFAAGQKYSRKLDPDQTAEGGFAPRSPSLPLAPSLLTLLAFHSHQAHDRQPQGSRFHAQAWA